MKYLILYVMVIILLFRICLASKELYSYFEKRKEIYLIDKELFHQENTKWFDEFRQKAELIEQQLLSKASYFKDKKDEEKAVEDLYRENKNLFNDYLEFLKKWKPRFIELNIDLEGYIATLPSNLSPREKRQRIINWLSKQKNLPKYMDFPHNKLAIEMARERGQMNNKELDKFYDNLRIRIISLKKLSYFFPLMRNGYLKMIDNLLQINECCRKRDHRYRMIFEE